MGKKLKKSGVPKGWELHEGTSYRKRVYKNPALYARIWQEEGIEGQAGLWRPKFELLGMQSFNIWSAGQVFGPHQKTLKAAIAWIKRRAPAVVKKIKMAIAREKKNSLGCECP